MAELQDLYQYERIPHPDYLETTRILTLSPGDEDEPLSGTLATMSTTDPGPFEALSYVWGTRGSWDEIEIDGKSVRLTASLAAMLRRLRHTDRPRVIWADQICINQEDLIERSQQVRHMSSIYQKASKVLVWLGNNSTGHAKNAFDLIGALVAIAKDTLLLQQFKEKQATFDWFPEDSWAALGELFRQPWFDRKWILQEIGTDTPSEVYWGDHSVPWDHIAEAAALLKNHGYLLRRKYDLLVWKPWYMNKRFSLQSYKANALNFTYELHRARWQQASDPRDHIFALLGHPSVQQDADGNREIEADYLKSVEQVFHETAVQILGKGESLMMLNVIQHETLELAMKRPTLPTWVPQWDKQEALYNLLGDDTCVYRPYHPHEHVLPKTKLLDSNRILVLEGVTVDTISSISKIFGTSDITLESSTIAALWLSLPECINEEFTTSRKTYPTGESSILAFLETLSAIKKRKQQAPIPISERLSDGAYYLTRAYGTSHNIGEDIKLLGSTGDCYRWMERASGGANGRRFARGKEGFYALCPPAAREGDILCLLLGGQTLFCLRPDGDDYLFVGECYVHGFMEGRAYALMRSGQLPKQEFRIK